MRDSKQYEPASREKLEQVVADHRGFIFDLDGTVYLGDELIDDAAEVIEQLREAGRRTVFLSNKPIARREVYARKLDRLGIPCLAEDVINSPLVLAQYLAETHPGARVYPVAEEPVIDELRDHGLRIAEEPAETDVVVVSWDRDFNYDKLRIA
ncbi:MAG: HAD-IIA family hydrolase, partial [Planctomycetota bacterium]